MSCITEILKLKGNKDALVPEGNWIAVEGGGSFEGYEYLIVLNSNGHRCGYVAIPSFHPYSKTPLEKREFCGKEYDHYDYDKLNIDCHGGLTFMSPHHGLKKLLSVPCNDMWIGFDCGHCWDSCDVDSFVKYFGKEMAEPRMDFFNVMRDGTIKTYDYAKNECQSIIRQLKDREEAA